MLYRCVPMWKILIWAYFFHVQKCSQFERAVNPLSPNWLIKNLFVYSHGVRSLVKGEEREGGREGERRMVKGELGQRGRDGSVALVNDRKGVAVDHMDAPPGLQVEVPSLTLSLSSKRLANVSFKNPNSGHFLSSLVFFPSYLFGRSALGMCAVILPFPFSPSWFLHFYIRLDFAPPSLIDEISWPPHHQRNFLRSISYSKIIFFDTGSLIPQQ